MSVIRASVTDQRLKITEAPIVASGGQNETKVAFTFCEKWNGFTKLATFYRDENEVYTVPLDANDTCVVPWEVCYESGSFYIGVFGDKDNVRRTSTTVRYKVKKGAITDGTSPSNPVVPNSVGMADYYHAVREELGKPEGEISVAYINGLYDALVDEYPGKITKNEVNNDDGTFTNYEYVITTGQYNKVGIRGTKDKDIKKPKYLIMSGIHGKEKAVMMSLYRFVRDILSGHNVPSHFLESSEIHVVPCGTPYGVDNTSRFNANGVNINRNFDWEWNNNSGEAGNHATSEKETQAIVNWLNANKDADLFIDLHNSSNVHEVAMVLGLKGNEAVNMAKRTSLRGLDRVIPFWRDVIQYTAHEVVIFPGSSSEKIELRDPVFSYSSYVEGTSYGGIAVHYAAGKLGIPSIALETTACANEDCTVDKSNDLTEIYSAETIAAGADAIGNILLEFYKQYLIGGDIKVALDAIIQMQSTMIGGDKV